MQLTTNKTHTFDEWFETLQRVSLQEYAKQIHSSEHPNYILAFNTGLNQLETLEQIKRT